MLCRLCGFESKKAAHFCSRCGGPLSKHSLMAKERATEFSSLIGGRSGPARPKTLVTWFASLLGLRQWLAEASDPNASPILGAPVSENAKRVYIYLAGIVYAFGSSHSRLNTIAMSTGLSRGAARKAITELERRRFLSHSTRNMARVRGIRLSREAGSLGAFSNQPNSLSKCRRASRS
jgi:predicted amidophosphoribosyltransferase